ncbi:MAG: Serine/threonine-protein kinase PknD [Phycisphaerae bacterium]|nr:Serine/threonine-protein kinase PknD [Phycisphaerae bacterium]
MSDSDSSGPDSSNAAHERLIAAARGQHEAAAEASRGQRGNDAATADSVKHGPAFALPPPDSFAGYRILREIHRGGQGVVYQAMQKSTNRKVALKVMREGPFAGAADKARFDREVQVLGQLKHPNIVTIHDTGVAAGCHFFVMDYISGQPLDVYMASGARSIGETLKLFATICEAVNAAHLRGVIHRDLKPGNVRIDNEGAPHILDFGLAKVAASDAEAAAMTMTGQFVGSLPWASPEQAEGAPGKLDVRTDVYSLGVILYQMLTGRFPYEVIGNMRDVLDRIMRAAPIRPRDIRREISDELETIVLKCLSKERERRYQSAGELGRDVERYLRGEPIEAKRDSLGYLLRKQLRRHRLTLLVGAAFLLLLFCFSITSWTLYLDAQRRGAQAARAAQRAERAEHQATNRLRDAYLAQARARRVADSPGRRFESLQALRQAAELRPTLELRNEAIACMALCDVQVERTFPRPRRAGAVAFTDQLDRYAIGTLDGEITIHSTEGHQEQVRLDGPGLEVHVLRFSSDGRHLAVKYHTDRTVACWVWDIESGEPRLQMDTDDFREAMAVAADGRYAALGLRTGGVTLYGLPSGEAWKTIGVTGDAAFVAFHPSGRMLAVCGFGDPPVSVWDVDSEQCLASMNAPAGVYHVAWSADGRRLAGACKDRNVYLWDARTGRLEMTFAGHRHDARFVWITEYDDLLLSRGWDNTLRLWNPRTGAPLMGPLQGCLPDAIAEYRIAGRIGSSMGILRFEPAHECRRLISAANHEGAAGATFAPDDRLVATHGEDGLTLWDRLTGKEVAAVSTHPTWSAVFLPDGSGLVSTTAEGAHYWPLAVDEDGVRVGVPKSWPQPGINRVCLGPDGRSVVICGARRIVVLEVPEWRERVGLEGYGGVDMPALSPDGRWLFTGVRVAHEAIAKLWDMQTREPVREFPGANRFGTFSPDGRWLVVGDNTVPEYAFYEVGSWTLHHRIPLEPGTTTLVPAFTPDGRIAAVPRTRFDVMLLDAASGRQLATLAAPEQEMAGSLCVSRDGTCLAVGTSGRITYVWDLARIRRQLREMGLDWDDPEVPLGGESALPHVPHGSAP